MLKSTLKCLPILLLLIVQFSFASQSLPLGNPDNPEITQFPCGTDTIRLGSVPRCWPGDQILVPVQIKNADALDKVVISFTNNGNLTYAGFDTIGTPWTGSISDTTIGSVTYVFLEEETGVLSDNTQFRDVIYLKFTVYSLTAFSSTLSVSLYGDQLASKVGNPNDCDLGTLGSAGNSTITVPDDTVKVFIDWTTAYSSQANDETDSCKPDHPLLVPVKLYSNFPCGNYSLWFDIPDSLHYIGIDSREGGAQAGQYQYFNDYRVYGCPPSRPAENDTLYLADLKFSVGNFASAYNSNPAYKDSLFFQFISGHEPALSFASNWGGSTEVPYNSIASSIGGTRLPQYTLTVDIKCDTLCGDTVLIPVTINPSFYAQNYELYIKYNPDYLTYSSVYAGSGSTIPSMRRVDQDTLEDGWKLDKFESFADNQDCKYFIPDTEQTMFTIKFQKTAAFHGGDSASVEFYTGSWVSDWFSPDNGKIIVQSSDGAPYFVESPGYVKRTTFFSLSATVTRYKGTQKYDAAISISSINFTADTKAMLLLYMSPDIDSVTRGSYALDSVRTSFGAGANYTDVVELYPHSTISNNGVLCHVWFHTTSAGVFQIVKLTGATNTKLYYNSGQNYSIVASGVTVYYSYPKIDNELELPLQTALGQNYPNPFNGNTIITYSLAEPGYAQIEIFDVLGRKTKTLLSSDLEAGEHTILWDGTNTFGDKVTGGIYFYSLKCGDFRESKKMLYLK